MIDLESTYGKRMQWEAYLGRPPHQADSWMHQSESGKYYLDIVILTEHTVLQSP